ncbi:Holliday junction branch migration protein RuvA [Aquibacillus sp. 3ASR75-11]|uniref:Holliday junction branch migration complex subunit RuvA n=1 Tax=Terrihalobacillus insolitus TaxID=2950438 RepID=A0A9X4ALK4_9BACI|nr:Holliday junction branch migration protein RuvA [Terrihalobacillus insolitus]MDC3412444.1 Holliday junction branch migration protein RuvA [Terrihalobacillus insolitus]MDC3423864.1 Holliday junction branch migration protein RuvA [Terrihalobacillus insolitus]
MIAYIKGTLIHIEDQAVIVESHGIGYQIFCPNPFVFQGEIGSEVKIYTFHYVREDAQILYGFKKTEEKALFSKILNVSGIGPKGALSILSTAKVGDFVAAIEREDEQYLTSFSGVGKKTARQMMLDLKGKLPFVDTTESIVEGNEETHPLELDKSVAIEDAVEAMKALGYSDKELKPILPILKKEQHANTDEFVRKGLALMMQKG